MGEAEIAPLIEKVAVGWYFRRLTTLSGQNLKRLVEARARVA